MTGIKFVPTSEWQVLHRTEECAERTWDRGTGASLVPKTTSGNNLYAEGISYKDKSYLERVSLWDLQKKKRLKG